MRDNTSSIPAIIRLAVTLAVSVLTALGFAVDADALLMVTASVAALACMAWSWWKNNNVTEAAKEAQMLLNEIKANERAEEM